MLLTPSPVSSKFFTFKDNMFVAEISEFPRTHKLGRVYDDACDYGFTIISEKTGKLAVFVHSGTDTDGEDTQGWRFTCVTPGLKQLKALIIND